MPDTELKQLQKQWKSAPHSEAFYPLARAYFDIGLHDAAADVLQQGLRNYPTHAKGLTLLGQIQSQRGDEDEARDTFQKALTADPCCSDPLCGLAELEIATGNYARAENLLNRAESLAQSAWSEKLRLQLERKQAAIPEVEVDLPFVTLTMVELYLKQGMEEKAIAALQQLVAQNSHDNLLRQRLDGLLSARASLPELRKDNILNVEARLHAWLRAVEHRKQRR